MQNSTPKKLKYYIYEGNNVSRDETLTFSNKKAALDYVRTQIAFKNALRADWIAHVMLSKDCSFVETMTTENYYDNADGSKPERFCGAPAAAPVIDAEEAAWQAQMTQDAKRIEIRDRFQAIEAKCSDLFHKGSPIRHQGHQDAWLLCASALDNAGDTAQERHFEFEGLEYWECALGSLECLCCDAKPRVRRWFRKIGFKF